jgi:hypothetical protein
VDWNGRTTRIRRSDLHIRQYVNGSRSRSLRLAHADPNAYTSADPNAYTSADPHAYTSAQPDSYTHATSNADANPDTNSNPDADTSAEHRRSDQLKLVGLCSGKQSFQPAGGLGDRGLRVVDRSHGHGIIAWHDGLGRLGRHRWLF